MGLLNIFKSAKSEGPSPMPSGSYTVDRDGKVVTSTISSAVAGETLEKISAQVLQTFKDAKQAELTITEFSVAMGVMNIKARELRGGAMIFLAPRGSGTTRK
jgi:hypothetical protein